MVQAPAFDSGTSPQDRFDHLADEWGAASRFLSSVQQMCMLPSYQRIIGMGPEAVPFILARMTRSPGHWFWALEAITGTNPVAKEHEGDLAQMTVDWLDWAAAAGIHR